MTMFTITVKGLDYHTSDEMDADELHDVCDDLLSHWPDVTLNIEAVPS